MNSVSLPRDDRVRSFLCLVCILIYIGEQKTLVIEEVESTGTARVIDIQHTAKVKAGDKITAIGSSHESLEYLALPGTQAPQLYDAGIVVEKVLKAEGNIRLQLERPLEQVQPLFFIGSEPSLSHTHTLSSPPSPTDTHTSTRIHSAAYLAIHICIEAWKNNSIDTFRCLLNPMFGTSRCLR